MISADLNRIAIGRQLDLACRADLHFELRCSGLIARLAESLNVSRKRRVGSNGSIKMSQFQLQRSTQIDASPQQVFEAVADFGTWTKWSPWLCADSNARVDISPKASAVGSIYAWKGDSVGEGEIEHQRLEPGRLIEDELRFLKPFRSRSQVAFTLEPAGEGTRVTWHMHGSLPWFMFWMRPHMECFIGMDYERGLKMLKEWIETGQVLSKTEIRGIEP
ncbi:MAG: SRPBCC family protein, partial [Planctomycetes bacterium]|nr:SRPBCC family protein [Planctomycetota bacterium]